MQQPRLSLVARPLTSGGDIAGSLPRRSLVAIAAAMFGACSPLPPLPFELIDDGKVFQGAFFPSEERLEATIGDKKFQGFYIVASGIATTQGTWPARRLPSSTTTTYSSNAARAMLTSQQGDRLSCEFLLEGRRAIGECKAADGRVYQLVAQER